MNEKLIVVISNNCPSCPFIKRQARRVARKKQIPLIVKNKDRDKEALEIIYKYGFWFPRPEKLKQKGEIEPIWAVPQLFYVDFEKKKEGEWHYLAVFDQIEKKEVKPMIKRRLKNARTDETNYLKKDMKERKPLTLLGDKTLEKMKELENPRDINEKLDKELSTLPTIWQIRKRGEKILRRQNEQRKPNKIRSEN